MVENYYTIKEASENWGLTERWVRNLCSQGKVKGAVQFGRAWAILTDAKRPHDGRISTGEYRNWRNKNAKQEE
ncbi:DNA-binding protein [uncultured Phascolarctobacterium sp.]|uniref:DNA-binding protein n=1 Tax=uncultured Phascolarctobacterium sp. TaxID=512296 RepID=UPI0027D9B3CC|nr:DNA-binding protein [uncultured Phascolarctobacterium sp.]